jgi:NAD(P)-dependent dehydrogenase (short-subunit alcohol dehydrogenase family)
MQTDGPGAALAGKSIVIIGGTSGLGFSAARAFLATGASGIVITGRNPKTAESAVAALGSITRVLTGDASSPAHARDAIDLAIKSFGAFDGLYHVAGGSGRKLGDGPLHEVTDAGIDATLALNLESVILSNRAAIRQFLARKQPGVILNMSSVLAWSPSPKYFATHIYATAKAAVIGLTKSLAAHYARDGIRCNVIAPALVETPMAQRAATDPEILRFIATKQPLDGGRIGRPEDLDAAVVYLMSDAARFTTGQVLAVDGGWSVSDGQIPIAS